MPREFEMQLIRQARIEGKFLKYTRATRAITDTQDSTVEIQDDLVRFLQLIVIAFVGKLFGCVMKRLESKSWSAILAPGSAEDLTMRILNGERCNAQAVALGVEER